MTLFAWAVVLGVLAGGWVVAPIIRRRSAALADAELDRVSDAEARQRVALASLTDVEYDRLGGKLDDEDYRRLRGQLEHEALAAIRAAEDPAGAPPAGPAAHACGFPNPPGSRFCSGCGARL